MAFLAFLLFVPTTQGKVGVLVVIKRQFFPASGCMTLAALFSVSPLVDIINFVAGNTNFLCFLIAVTRVTTGTGCFFVFADKGELGFLVFMLGIQP